MSMSISEKWKTYTGSVLTVTRYVGVFAGGITVTLGLAGLSPEEIKRLLDALQTLGNGLSTAMTALGTIGSIAAAAYAAYKSTPKQQSASVAALPDEIKAKAVASLPEAQQASIASAIPDSVVAKAAGDLPGVEITVDKTASNEVRAVAADPSVPSVNAA